MSILKYFSSEKTKDLMSTGRLEAIIDGVSATAMTLIVFSITVPEGLNPRDSLHLLQLLGNTFPMITIYFSSFLILSSIWIGDLKQLRYIKHTDMAFIWINLVKLMFVVLIPFCVDFINSYGDFILSQLIFNLNFIILAVITFLKAVYVERNFIEFGVEEKDLVKIKLGKYKGIIFIAISALAMFATFISRDWATLTYLFLPLFFRILESFQSKKI